MEEQKIAPTANERRGLALAALIMSLVALLCAFIVGWRTFAIVVAIAAAIVGIFVLTKVKRPGRSRTMSLLAIIFSLAAGIMAGYYLANMAPEPTPEEVPAELHDSAAAAPDDETLERLRMSMDSSQAE